MQNLTKTCVVSCPISTRSGYGARSRDFVRALIEAKPDWDIKILSQRWGQCPMDALNDDDDMDLISRVILGNLTYKPNVWVQITVPNEFQPVGDFNIGVTAGVETTIMPHTCLEGVNRMDLTLVSSEFTKNVLQNTMFDKKDSNTGQVLGQLRCEKPVEVLFEGVDLEVYDTNVEIEPRIKDVFKNIKEDFCYLFVGHWLSGEFKQDRKNVSGLIHTFLETFKNKPNPPALILKTNGASTSVVDRVDIKRKIQTIKDSVKAKSLPNIYLLHSTLTDWEVNSLYNHPKVKCHVSFTRGEGFGRPLLEASISGKPMVISGWSGHMDFINPKYISTIGGNLEDVHPTAANEFLLKEAKWFTIDYNEAAKTMVDIKKNYPEYLKYSKNQSKYSKDNFSYDKMVDSLKSILGNEVVNSKPVSVGLKLPKLKKVGQPQEAPKLKLPKLKKVE
jgi:glycosyltransferase involved in cell wall biosynthesis